MKLATVLASALALAIFPASLARAQGKSQEHKQNPPPSRSDLPASGVTPGVAGPTPFAWIEDASLIEPGSVSVTTSFVRWQGTDLGEVDLPVIEAAVGLAPRVHLAATVPRVVGSTDPLGASGGVGTSYFSAKVAIVDDRTSGVKLSVAPTLEVLGTGVLQSLTPGERRVHFGLPVSVEGSRGAVRGYGGGGYFSRGIWFTGAGIAVRAADKTYVSAGYNRSWRRAVTVDVPLSDRSRNELTGGAAYALARSLSVFGSIARSIATLDENGAGTTFAAGLSVFFSPPTR